MKTRYLSPRACAGWLGLVVLFFGMLTPPVHAFLAEQAPGLVCDEAARRASMETGVPLDVMMAITRTETGRGRDGTVQPWPWTVNMEGRGAWFDSRVEATDFALEHHANGATSFDAGCFQINYRWHGEHFASIAAMFDPLENARYAARFLARLHDEFGGWEEAAGAFHSRTPSHASRYLRVFRRHRSALPDVHRSPDGPHRQGAPVMAAGPNAPGPTSEPRENTFPLLQAGEGGQRLGSLVPQSVRVSASLFAAH